MNKLFAFTITTLAATGASTALAHPGHDVATGAIAGLMHPVTGIDHLIFLVGAGALLALTSARDCLLAGAAMVAALAGGALLGLIGVQLPALDWVIAASVVAVGVALAMAPFAGGAWVLAGAALFALCHGIAHGAEASAPRGAFVAGFLLSSLLVSSVAALVARVYLQRAAVRVAMGTSIGAGGLALLGTLLFG